MAPQGLHEDILTASKLYRGSLSISKGIQGLYQQIILDLGYTKLLTIIRGRLPNHVLNILFGHVNLSKRENVGNMRSICVGKLQI